MAWHHRTARGGVSLRRFLEAQPPSRKDGDTGMPEVFHHCSGGIIALAAGVADNHQPDHEAEDCHSLG